MIVIYIIMDIWWKKIKIVKLIIIKSLKCNVLFISSRSVPGKTCLIYRIIENKFITNTSATIGNELQMYYYDYNKKQYKLKLYDSGGDERFRDLSLNLVKISNIVVYLFDLTEDDNIDEEFIDSIKEKDDKKEKIIYLIGNKLDMIDECKLEKYRLKAKNLIDRGRVHKYFELSAKSNEGIDFFLKFIKIDAAMKIDGETLSEGISEIQKKNKDKDCLII